MAKKLNVRGSDSRLDWLFDYFVREWPSGDTKTRDIWANRIRKAASQPGFEFDHALRRFSVYVLVGSKKYSALTSVKKTDYPRNRDVEKVVARAARLIQKEGSLRESSIAAARAREAASAAQHTCESSAASYSEVEDAQAAYWAAIAAGDGVRGAAATARGALEAAASSHSARNAAMRDYAAALLYFVEQETYGRGKRRGNPSTEKVPSLEKLLGTRKAPSRTSNPSKKKLVINGWEVYTYMSGPPHQWGARIRDPNGSGVHLWRTVNKCEFDLNVYTVDSQSGSFIQLELTSGCDPEFYERTTMSTRLYGLVLEAPKFQAEKVLKAATLWADKKIPKKQNPSKRSDSKPKVKKTTKRKAPLAKTLISKCRKTWDHYCAKPSKKRLEEVFDHLETMKESSAKTVKEERARCLRAANKEAKRLKMKR